jgi:DNA helicase HerA-like ATPase
MRGAGKTNAARVMAEELHKAGRPFVAIDPVGAWWGLRASRDGKPDGGLPIPIFGGDHGDVPLEESGGEVLADFLVEETASAVVDVSALSESAKHRFLTAFTERLFRRNSEPLVVFLEEADDYAPQRSGKGPALATLGAMQRLVKRGRFKGLVPVMVTQRSAAINKDLLTQIENLVVLRTTSPQDRKAIEGWVTYHGQSAELLESLSSLETGEAWLWSPHALGTLERFRFRESETFDSGATPRGGKRRVASLADVDLGALRDRMAATIEKAKAEDPRELRRQIAALKKETLCSPDRRRSQGRSGYPRGRGPGRGARAGPRW